MEWHIDNFSCWNAAVHGQKISCPRVLSGLPSELIPLGSGGRLEARLLGGRAGDLFFLGPDGSPICAPQLVSGGGELPPGPTFEEVVARIKKTTGDRLTVRFRCSDDDVREQHLRTVIEVFETSLEVNPKVMGGRQDVSCFDFPGNKKVKSFSLSHSEDDRFELTPSSVKGGLVTNMGLFDSKILVRSCVRVLDRGGFLVSCDEQERIFHDRTPWVFSDTLNMAELAKKGFTLQLKFKVIPGSVSKGLCHLPFTPVGVDTIPGPENALSNDLLCLYQDLDFSDFELNCGGISFPTHRAILGGRSPVFKRMLLSDMEEAASGRVRNIKDLDPSTLALFLTFLYTGAVDDLQVESALKLYYAADKYQVPSLKRECAKTLCADLSLSNVCDVLSMAERHEDCRVASAARRFIDDNYDEVLASDGWKFLKENDPSLAEKTLAFCDERMCDREKLRRREIEAKDCAVLRLLHE